MNTNRISFQGQVRVYTGKCFRLFTAEKQWKNLISTLIIILLICLVTGENMFVDFRDTKNGAFAVICACIWIGLFNSIQSVCRERAIVKREHRTGMRIPAYITAHVIYELALCAAETLVVVIVVIVKNYSHLPPKGLILGASTDMFLTLLLVVFSSDMLALLLSCIVKNENTAMTVMPFVLIIQLVMSGAIFELDGIAEKVSYVTISKWGLSGICSIANTDAGVEQGNWLSGTELYEATAAALAKSWLILLLFILLYILLSMLVLSGVDRDER